MISELPSSAPCPPSLTLCHFVFDEFWDDSGEQVRQSGRRQQPVYDWPHREAQCRLGSSAAHGESRCRYRRCQPALELRGRRLALLVGVCGAVPRVPSGEVLLGDVIISKSVVQYDFGRQYSDKFVRKDTAADNLSRPNKGTSGGLLASLETDRIIDLIEQRTAIVLQELQKEAAKSRRIGKDRYKYPRCRAGRSSSGKIAICIATRPRAFVAIASKILILSARTLLAYPATI